MNKLRKPRKSKPWPSRILLCTTLADSGGSPIAWACAGNEETGFICHYGNMDDDSLSNLHLKLGLASLPGEDCLVICDNAYAFLTQTGFWQRCKDRFYVLKGHDERNASAPRCIVEDPPTIVHYAMVGRGGAGVICDVRNWGWMIPDSAQVVADTSKMGESWQKEMLRAIMAKILALKTFCIEYDNLLRKCNLGDSWRMTAGSQAFYGFRQNYMQSPIEASRADESEQLIERCSYGGRCECFHLGEVAGPVYQYDVNQLYSWAASVGKFPVEYLGDCTNEVASMSAQDYWDVAADVLISTECNVYPYRASGEHGDKGNPLVIYPIGEFRTFLAGPELQLAVDCGHVREFYSASKYRTDRCLEEWANRMWQARVAATADMKKAIKSISLALYGKFGQRLREWSADSDCFPPSVCEVGDWYTASKNGGVDRHRVLCGQCATEIRGGYVQQSSPPIATWITSLARLHLQRLINEAGQCYYCDTDSLWVDREAHLRLQASGFVNGDLGSLRLVADWERVDFRGIKHYVAEGELSHSGVPQKAEIIGESTYRWEENCTFNGHMQSREWPSRKIVVRSYRGTSLYRHGIPQADGSIVPHRLG